MKDGYDPRTYNGYYEERRKEKILLSIYYWESILKLDVTHPLNLSEEDKKFINLIEQNDYYLQGPIPDSKEDINILIRTIKNVREKISEIRG